MLIWRIAALSLALCLALISDSAQSQRHSRTNPPRAESTQPTAPDQRGTDQLPLSVKIVPSPDSKEKGEQELREREDKAETDKKLAFETQRIADYTFYLGIFTLAVFCAATGQIVLFWIQLRYIRQSLKDAKIAADAAKESADTAREAIALTRNTFIAANRPKLIVLEVVVWQPSSFEKMCACEPYEFIPGEELRGHVELVNIGGTPANIEFMCQTISWTQKHLPMSPPYNTLSINRSEMILAAGERHTWAGMKSRNPMGQEADAINVGGEGWRLYVMGWIRYTDDRKIILYTRFCRQLQYPERRFRAIDDPDYEYAD
jgi:hypothetical protein